MPQLFDAYIIVDWSASAKPVSGANSIWVGILAQDKRRNFKFTATNPKTRLEAREIISETITRFVARGDKVLAGFDFALGYPAGTAAAIGLSKANKPAWYVMHKHLAANVEERLDNSNQRFALAAEMNKVITAGPHPFWGAPKRNIANTLSPKKGNFASGGLREHRFAEAWVKSTFKANPKSVWQLLGAGAVGSQALLGIPTVHALRANIQNSQIWPFETGLKPLTQKDLETVSCVFAEIYPSTIQTRPEKGEILDRAQVRILANHLQILDSRGELAEAFGPPNSLEREKIPQIIGEEGWILAK